MEEKKENPKKSPEQQIQPVVAKPAGPENGTRVIIKAAKRKDNNK